MSLRGLQYLRTYENHRCSDIRIFDLSFEEVSIVKTSFSLCLFYPSIAFGLWHHLQEEWSYDS